MIDAFGILDVNSPTPVVMQDDAIAEGQEFLGDSKFVAGFRISAQAV